jgi:hypothetical protein
VPPRGSGATEQRYKAKALRKCGGAQKDVERSMLQQDKVIAELREIKQILKDKGN